MPENITTMKNSTSKVSPSVPSTSSMDEKPLATQLGLGSSSASPLPEKLQAKASFVSKSKDKCTSLEEKISEEEKKDGGAKQHKIRMPQRKGGMQLWQFLYALLEDAEKRYSELIEWTHNRKELEFRLNDPEAIALWWGIIKHRANMTYERLSRSLRYYYDRGILKKMGGERYLYRFCIDPEDMYKHIGLSDSRPVLKPMPMPVTKWVSNRMIPSHPLEPFYITPPDYMSLGLTHHPTPLPPPPPYPGYQLHTLQYQGSNQMSYDFFNEHESEQSFLYNGAHDGLPSFNVSSLTNQETSSLYASNTTLAVASNSPVLSFTSQLQPGQERSFSTGELLSDSDSDCSQHQSISLPTMPVRFASTIRDHEVFQYSPESSTQFQYDCNSPLDSGSGEEIELEDIIPLIESMEDSDSLPVSVSTSPCSFTSISNMAISREPPFASLVSSPTMSTSYMSICSQMPLQTSPSLCNSSYASPSAWIGEDMWNFS